MRLFVGLLPLVALAFASSAAPAMADDEFRVQDAMLKKASEELVATPIQEFMKDAYQFFVRQGGSRLLRRLRYLTAGMGATRTVLSLSDFAMEKLRTKVFKSSINERMWRMLRMELYFDLLEWWLATPENPLEAADLGLWHALVRLQKDVLGPALRGSSRVDTINAMLLDPELTDIKTWVDEWRSKTQRRRGKKRSAPAVKTSDDE